MEIFCNLLYLNELNLKIFCLAGFAFAKKGGNDGEEQLKNPGCRRRKRGNGKEGKGKTAQADGFWTQ
jgi:hypothetical protein